MNTKIWQKLKPNVDKNLNARAQNDKLHLLYSCKSLGGLREMFKYWRWTSLMFVVRDENCLGKGTLVFL